MIDTFNTEIFKYDYLSDHVIVIIVDACFKC